MIFTEEKKRYVVFSNLFARHYPELWRELVGIIGGKHIGALMHTKDYWARDYMPVQVDDFRFAKFVYNPDYLHNQKEYITDVEKVLQRAPIFQACMKNRNYVITR